MFYLLLLRYWLMIKKRESTTVPDDVEVTCTLHARVSIWMVHFGVAVSNGIFKSGHDHHWEC